MEHCLKEQELRRISRLLDGNGQSGLIKEVAGLVIKIDDMSNDMKDLRASVEAQATGLSAVAKYMNSQEVIETHNQQRRKERRQLLYFAIAQGVAVLGLLLTIILKLL